jgi:hypothetical protein
MEIEVLSFERPPPKVRVERGRPRCQWRREQDGGGQEVDAHGPLYLRTWRVR